ncbi:hypothetical protein LEP1GSC124_1052 [Leptospira interrogans serovar Pyrogenes str. 200701872]|uniref:Uncharacterized protein n=1 Tax=Leptospira interrogans serovar Pyrogenes str. 200701872 TaxID=1193029 RepID=M7ABG2_LEPIR|nr:hypothetical protein LEP1GSC124_1052 [Leptospira interrogans serovar Pyrogenes str. 200701872]
MGWSISNSNDSKLVCTALSKAIECRNPPKGLVFSFGSRIQLLFVRNSKVSVKL